MAMRSNITMDLSMVSHTFIPSSPDTGGAGEFLPEFEASLDTHPKV